MTVPTLVSITSPTGSSGTTVTVASGVDFSAGDLVIAMVRAASVGTISLNSGSSAGWTRYASQNDGSSTTSVALFYKISPTAAETLIVDNSGASGSISGTFILVSGANSIAVAVGTAVKDPPSLDIGSVQDVLWIEHVTVRAGSAFGGASTGYSNLTASVSSPFAVMTATKDGAASQTEDPDAVTNNSSLNRYTDWTIGTWYVPPSIPASTSGDIATINLSAPAASAAADGDATSQLATITISAPTSSETGDASISGSLSTITLSAPNVTGSAAAIVSGALATISLTAPRGAGTVSITGTGAIGTISVSAPQSGGSGTASTSGQVGTITLQAPIAAVSGAAAAMAAIATVTLQAPGAGATGTASIAADVRVVTITAPSIVISASASFIAPMAGAVSITAPAAAGTGIASVIAGIATITVLAALGFVVRATPPERTALVEQRLRRATVVKSERVVKVVL